MAKKLVDTLVAAAESGDSEALRLLHDVEEERGRSGCLPRPPCGKEVVIYTVTFYVRGVLLGEDHEYYLLAPNSKKIFETGPLAQFYESGKAANEEVIPRMAWIRKGAGVIVTEG